MSDYVQVRNPRSDRWVKIDRTRGVIVSHKQSPGPYKGVPVADWIYGSHASPKVTAWEMLEGRAVR